MPTLLLQCVAPLQVWDTQSRFGVRTTEREPSKSGIIGLLCAALGRPRTEPVDDLATLKMGVRVDKEGEILRDWHTAGKSGYLKASGQIDKKNAIISTRYYLSDAAFLVGLQGQRETLQYVYEALANPRWMLFLGRKACPPSMPPFIPDGLVEQSLLEALQTPAWLGNNEKAYERLESVRVVIEDTNGEQVRQDVPISFAKGRRRFASRRIHTDFMTKPTFQRNPFMGIIKQEDADVSVTTSS